MKILILMIVVVFPFVLVAQEVKGAVLSVKTESQNKEAKQSEAKVKSAPQTSRRKVVLPPSSNNRVQRRPASTSPGVRRAIPVNRSTSPEKPPVLDENITIQLRGSVSNGPPLDLSLTGVGPIFQADVVAGDKHTILTHQYSVKPEEGGYRVEYSVGLRIRMEASRAGQAINYEYRDVSITGTVLAKEGEKVVISKNGDQELSLTLAKATKE